MDEERILNGLYVTYGIGCFIDDVTIHDMYMIREEKNQQFVLYKNGRGKNMTVDEAADWIMENYTNEESSAKEIKEEKIYLLHLMGVGDTKIGKYFGVSRQTIHKKIRDFEEKRLQEFRRF